MTNKTDPPIFHFCRFNPWSELTQYCSAARPQQWRSCCICNKIQLRKVWTGMEFSTASDANAVLGKVKS
jgi:hypothetical protein